MASWTQWTKVYASSGDREKQGSLVCCSHLGSQRVRRDLVAEQKANIILVSFILYYFHYILLVLCPIIPLILYS